MEQLTPRNQEQEAIPFELTEYPTAEVSRTFQAPVEQLWKAWSTPELVKQWWGPEGFSCPEAKLDFRVGGEYLFAMKEDSSDKINWSKGEFRELVPHQRIVCTDMFSDSEGKPIDPKEIGMKGDWPDSSLIHVEFEQSSAGQTTMHIRHEGIPKEMHDDCVHGWTSSLNKFARVVEAS
jgi:uncharacterized protein YndB with AHSA1/START domain